MLNNRIIYLMTLIFLFFVTTGFAEGENSGYKYASRTIEKGTKIQLIIGETVVPAILNESEASKALITKLPYRVKLQKYSHGYCGVVGDKLPYDQKQLHSGWLDGDIVYAKDSNELAILYKDEEISKELYDGLVTLGIVTAPLSTLENLDRSLAITIALYE